MKLILACPTYGPIDPAAVKSVRVAMMHASNNGHTWLGDSSPDRMIFAAARNAIAKEACGSEADAVFWCDSDVLLPVWAITRLAAYDKDFITGVYFQRHAPHWPLIAQYNRKRDTFQWLVKWDTDMLYPIDGCGFGCVLTSVQMLKDIQTKCEPSDDRESPWFNYRKFSEDLDFCMRAMKAGYQLWVDSGVLCGHLADPAPVTYDTYQKEHPEYFGGKKNGTIRSSNEGCNADVAADRDTEEADLSKSELQPGQL